MRTIFILILLVGLVCHAKDTNQPITLRYVKTGKFNNRGSLSFGTIFWATNHTANTQSVWLAAVEAKTGTNWIKLASPTHLPLCFQPLGAQFAQRFLPVNAAGYATLQLPSQPTGTTWRVRVVVQPLLTGLEDMKTRVADFPNLLNHHLRGDTNSPLNPFDKSVVYHGPPTEVVSQEISGE